MRLESPPRLKTQFTEPRNRPRDLAMLLTFTVHPAWCVAVSIYVLIEV